MLSFIFRSLHDNSIIDRKFTRANLLNRRFSRCSSDVKLRHFYFFKHFVCVFMTLACEHVIELVLK